MLCEGDLTFHAADIDKFLAYIPHADVVNGSRIVEQLQERDTQLSLYMHYGNLFAGKVLEMKHLGAVSLTDVGTTYKLCRNAALRELMPCLDPRINLEFNAYFLDTALKAGVRIIECPVSFYPRVGASKGGNVNNRIATRLGLRMFLGFLWTGRVLAMTITFIITPAFRPTRAAACVWQTLVACEFQKQIPPEAVVLELGAGYGDFINAVKARRRIAVDRWPGMTDISRPASKGLVAGVSQLDGVPDQSVAMFSPAIVLNMFRGGNCWIVWPSSGTK